MAQVAHPDKVTFMADLALLTNGFDTPDPGYLIVHHSTDDCFRAFVLIYTNVTEEYTLMS